MEEVSLIVNPRAGRGRVGKELPKLVEALSEAGTESAVYETEGPGHASELARRAAERGAGVVVAVGGDGTVNEVVNGLVADDHPVGTADLGVVAAGSGADFARSFDLPPHTGAGLRGILGDSSPLDVGKLTFVGPDGETATRYFVNVAEAGMAAATVRLAERFPRWLGRSRYLIAFWPTLARFKPREVTVETDDGSYTGRAHNALLANGRWFGGGMHISPHSDPDDGVADLQINVGPKRQSFTLIPRIFKGKHLPDDRIVQLSGKAGRIDAETPFLVEADGEVLGTTPLGFEMLPGILRVRS